MQRDLRGTDLYREAERILNDIRRPASGEIWDASALCVHRSKGVFTGTLWDTVTAAPASRICHIDLESGDLQILTAGPGTDQSPKFSPDGLQVAFLSDRHKSGNFQVLLLDRANGEVRPLPRVEGSVEYVEWSPDGNRLLLGAAGHDADSAGVQGAIAGRGVEECLPSWLPLIEPGEEGSRWRRLLIHELDTGQTRALGTDAGNVWQAVWCGADRLAAVVSAGPEEGHWYSACLHIVDVETGHSRRALTPAAQLGCLAAARSGRYLAVVEALCSDRGVAAGELAVLDARSSTKQLLDTGGVDVTHAEWLSEERLLVGGVRGFDTVIGVVDVPSGVFSQTWASRDLSAGWPNVLVAGLDDSGDCALIAEGFLCAPGIAVIRGGRYRMVRPLDLGYAAQAAVIGSIERLTWKAPDGLEIQGWLLLPRGQPPFATVMALHGGPVWLWRSAWLGRSGVAMLMLLARGFALFLPNPRGSAGRGQVFARLVLGDVGGADAADCLSGVEYLLARGFAAAGRLGVTGVSYGGYLTAWLITQDQRFAAAVAVAPFVNHVTAHLLSNIPQFVSLFLGESDMRANGKYFERSPVMHAHHVSTPTLVVCGAQDRCTPPAEALQFHRALRRHGVESVLLTYPEEGHGIRKWPAAVDYAARVVSWFEAHISSELT